MDQQLHFITEPRGQQLASILVLLKSVGKGRAPSATHNLDNLRWPLNLSNFFYLPHRVILVRIK